MTESRKIQIINSFPTKFDQAELGVYISHEEFAVFEQGIYSSGMDDKWNVFVINDTLHFSRSWTDHCIYQIAIRKYLNRVLLKNFQVNRDGAQYKNTDIEFDVISVKKLIQAYLNRDDIYRNPKLDIPLIKQVIGESSAYNQSASSVNVESTKRLYQTLVSPPNDMFYNIEGWLELESNLRLRAEDEQMITVYIQHKINRSGKTFYFNDAGTEYLGCIITSQKPDIDYDKLANYGN
ncbi:hypothetical protein KXQ82_00090 [Mucilaginibacter sp. HMF5004]|uniref:hypothetical protein n=1 Tax=Mucilaginibacter rivuli TaxID=2857527 RepID=UPI001C603F2D|nr:hypothetical protein [Mucilaginibacter rivuli]MBW4888084.1 hypothetical protein [Mucilaginibacter rivuli]